MILAIFTIIISFLLESYISMYIPISISNYNLFIPMFTIVSLLIIYPFFNNNTKNYLTVCLIFGTLYDIAFTNTLGLNLTLFFVLGYIIVILDNLLSNNLFNLLIKMICVIIIYDLITYFILIMVNYIDYSILTLIIKIGKSLILNILYLTVLYFITNSLAKKFHIKKTI